MAGLLKRVFGVWMALMMILTTFGTSQAETSTVCDHEQKQMKSDEKCHYEECESCHEKFNVEAHRTYSTGDCLETVKCTVCGYIVKNGLLAHANVVYRQVSYNGSNSYHEQYCTVCNRAITAPEAHQMTDSRDCTEPKKCTVCGYTASAFANHALSAWHSDNSDWHWRACTNAGCAYTETALHNYVHKIDREPTPSEEGYQTWTCLTCGRQIGQNMLKVTWEEWYQQHPTATPVPADTPEPTNTPEPETEKPTDTPKPTDTAEPETEEPADTPEPTNTPAKPETEKPTGTPEPSLSPKESETPNPVQSAEPTVKSEQPETEAPLRHTADIEELSDLTKNVASALSTMDVEELLDAEKERIFVDGAELTFKDIAATGMDSAADLPPDGRLIVRGGNIAPDESTVNADAYAAFVVAWEKDGSHVAPGGVVRISIPVSVGAVQDNALTVPTEQFRLVRVNGTADGGQILIEDAFSYADGILSFEIDDTAAIYMLIPD